MNVTVFLSWVVSPPSVLYAVWTDLPSSVPTANPTGSTHIFWLLSPPHPAPILGYSILGIELHHYLHTLFHSINLSVVQSLSLGHQGPLWCRLPDS